jgi:hypothetical protein|tara:strand:+ start:162 stop:482 length:321 start_codon:yes stop_codon:yes gene_type:complete
VGLFKLQQQVLPVIHVLQVNMKQNYTSPAKIVKWVYTRMNLKQHDRVLIVFLASINHRKAKHRVLTVMLVSIQLFRKKTVVKHVMLVNQPREMEVRSVFNVQVDRF